MKKLDALYAYQEAEQKKAAIETAIRSTPSRRQYSKLHKLLKEQQATIQKLTADMEEHEAQLKKLLATADKLDKQLELETSELETMQDDELTTGAEMTELREDIEKLNREIGSVVREIKNLQSELNKGVEAYKQTAQTYTKAKKEYDALKIVCEKERDDAADKLAACDAEIASLKERVDAALLEKYEKVKQHQPIPMAKVINNKCAGCNMSLPMVVLKRVYAPDTVVECENCGRILYAAEA